MARLASWLLPLILGSSSLALLSFPISQELTHRTISRRDDDEVPLYNITQVSYLIELSIGTPGQNVKVAVDTGSSELWVNPDCETAQSLSQARECIRDGQYDPNQSSTADDLNQQNVIPYGIGKVAIEYYRDNIAFPNSTINLTDVQFGAAVESQDLGEGILGLSFGNMSGSADLTYANIVDELYSQGVTQTRAFSVALGNQYAANAGVLTFGGLDTGKFTGDLHTLSILGPQNGEKLYRYWVQLDSLSATTNGTDKTYDDSNMPVVLDSGSSLCTLPESIVQDMTTDMNGQVDQQSGEVAVLCSEGDDPDNKLHFNFGSGDSAFTIDVPYSAFLIPATGPYCILGAIGATGSSASLAILGDTFMRSAYVVFDQDNMEISMAPYGGNCGDGEQDIPTDGVSSEGTITGMCQSADNGSNDNGNGNGNGDGSSGSGGGDGDGDGGNAGARPAIALGLWGLLSLVGVQMLLFS